MVFRDLLVVIGPGTEAAGRYGLGIAVACRATLTAATPVIEPYLPPHALAEIPQDIVARMHREAETAPHRVLRAFAESAKEWDVPAATLAFKAQAGDVDEEVGRLGRFHDATVIEQANPDGVDTSGMIEAALFRSGRPVLIVPYIGARPALRTALVAWDAGSIAARAIGDALPLLELARRVQVVTVNDDVSSERLRSAERMARHLARHGIDAEAKRLVSGDDITVGDMLLSNGADEAADLIVVGGYTHSRLRETVLGGTTRDMLRGMTVPVLMAH